MSFGDDFNAAAAPSQLDYFGESGRFVYEDILGDQTSCTAIIGKEGIVEEQKKDRRLKIRKRTVTISTDPDSDYGGVASPELNAKCLVDGTEYDIELAIAGDNGLCLLLLRRPEAMEKSRPHYRGGRKGVS